MWFLDLIAQRSRHSVWQRRLPLEREPKLSKMKRSYFLFFFLFPTSNPIKKTQTHLYCEIYSVLLPVCMVAQSVNRSADSAVSVWILFEPLLQIFNALLPIWGGGEIEYHSLHISPSNHPLSRNSATTTSRNFIYIYFFVFTKFCWDIQILVKIRQSNIHFTWRAADIYHIDLLLLPLLFLVIDTDCVLLAISWERRNIWWTGRNSRASSSENIPVYGCCDFRSVAKVRRHLIPCLVYNFERNMCNNRISNVFLEIIHQFNIHG